MKPNDKICIVSDLCDPTSIREYTITKVGKDTVQCGSVENTFYIAFCWPIRVRPELETILEKRKAIQKQLDDSISLIYQLKNEIARGEK